MADTIRISEPLAQPAAKRRLSFSFYVSSWVLIGLAAAAYLAALAFKPQFLTDYLPSLHRSLTQPQDNAASRAAAIAEAARLRESLSASQLELARVKQQLAQAEAQVKAGNLRITGLEQQVQKARETAAATPSPAETGTLRSAEAASPPSGPAAGSPAGEGANGQSPVKFELVNATPRGQDADPSAAPVEQAAAPPLPERRPATAPRAAASTPIAQLIRPTIPVDAGTRRIETGSVAVPAAGAQTKPEAAAPTAPVAFGPAVVTRSASSVGVRLTAGPSVDALRLSWSLMSERHGADLGTLEPRYVVGNTPSAPYALIAGPLADRSAAESLCASLARKGIPCSVDTFAGNAL